MRKSSLGRRASQPVRMDPDDMRASTSRRPLERRGSGIPQPGFSNKGRRSSSENRNRKSALPPMKRSKSQLNMNVLQTPTLLLTTPMREVSVLKFGSAQSQSRGLSPFSDGGHSSRKSTYSASSKPNAAIKDTRPLTDKAYQQQEIQKITHFLATYGDGHSLAPKGINLRQLTTKLFVDIVNHLLCFFDPNLCVNMTNYVSEIPLIMRKWSYVGNLNTSWLKTVNTQHAFPHVLGLLSWLVTQASSMMRTNMDAVLQEALQCDDDDDDMFPYGNTLLYMDHLLTQYGLWSKNEQAAEEKEENRFIEDLRNRNGVGEEELRELQEDVCNLEAQLNDPKEKAEMEAAVEEERKYNLCLKDYNLIFDYKTRMDDHLNTAETELEEIKIKTKAYEEARRELQNKMMDLKDQINRQGMSAQERDELIRQCSEIKSSVRENEEYIAAVSNQIYCDDLEMSKRRSNIQKKTQAYNKIIVTESCWLPELQALKDDVNILHPGALDELAAIDDNARQLLSNLKKRKADVISQITPLESDLLQVQESKSQAVHEHHKYEEQVKLQSESLNKIKLRCAEEALEMKKTIDSLKVHNQSRLNNDTLEENKAMLQQLNKKIDNGKLLIERNKSKATAFLQKSAAVTQGLIDSVSKGKERFLEKRDEVLQKDSKQLRLVSSGLDQIGD